MNWFWLNLSSLVWLILFGFSLPNKSTWLWYFVDVETKSHRDWPNLLDVETETEKFHRCRDWDSLRLGKRCRYWDYIETLADLWPICLPQQKQLTFNLVLFSYQKFKSIHSILFYLCFPFKHKLVQDSYFRLIG